MKSFAPLRLRCQPARGANTDTEIPRNTPDANPFCSRTPNSRLPEPKAGAAAPPRAERYMSSRLAGAPAAPIAGAEHIGKRWPDRPNALPDAVGNVVEKIQCAPASAERLAVGYRHSPG
jgi:hypothetical protein